MGYYREKLQTFDEHSLPDLDEVVLGALELFQEVPLPKCTLPYARPLVVGSGNAEATGRIMFSGYDAVHASESTFEEKLRSIQSVDGIVIVSASGGKHAPMIAQHAKEHGKHVTLLTNNPNAQAQEVLRERAAYDAFVFPKNREPYTYNTSTYMGMIFGCTKEDPEHIYRFITNTLQSVSFPDFAQYNKFYLIVPPEFSGIIRMLHIKFIELFGRMIARDIETSEYSKHDTTIVPAPDELFISFGYDNETWGKPEHRLTIPLPDDAKYAAMMAVGYYILGQIQKAHPPYFKDNIIAYLKEASKTFGSTILPIVE